MIQYPWPEPPERTEARVRALVGSVASADEVDDVRLEWVTPIAHGFDEPEAPWIALRLTVVAGADDSFQKEIWAPGWYADWEVALGQLASDLEDWVCETRFAWGQQRHARIPD